MGNRVDLDEIIVSGRDAEPPLGIWRPPPGPIVFQALILSRAYPWKSGKHSRKGKAPLKIQSSNYQAWKRWNGDITMVMNHFFRVMGGSKTCEVVDLDMLFVMSPDRSPPDRTNLGKSFEDILQGIVYANDRQVQGGDVRRVFIGDSIIGRRGETWEGPERIHFRVTSLS